MKKILVVLLSGSLLYACSSIPKKSQLTEQQQAAHTQTIEITYHCQPEYQLNIIYRKARCLVRRPNGTILVLPQDSKQTSIYQDHNYQLTKLNETKIQLKDKQHTYQCNQVASNIVKDSIPSELSN